MRLVIIISLLVILLAGGCGISDDNPGYHLYITGGKQSVGSLISIDGKKVGVMEKQIYSAPPDENKKKDQNSNSLKTGNIFAIGVALKYAGKQSRPIYDQPKAKSGYHELMFIGKDGKRLKKRIKVQSENYINIDFSRMNIQE